MSEQNPGTPGQLDPTIVDPEVQRRQAEIRALADERVSIVPMSQTDTDHALESFGLDAGKYDVYADVDDTHFGGGLKKFVSTEDPADVRVGYTKPHVGGNMSNPNRYLYNVMLQANGDITGKVSVENDEGTTYRELHYAASATDPESADVYRKQLAIVHDDVKYLALPVQDRRAYANRESAQTPASQGRIRKALSRLSLR